MSHFLYEICPESAKNLEMRERALTNLPEIIVKAIVKYVNEFFILS